MKVKVTQSCPTLCDPMDHTVHGILQARKLEWVAFPSPGDLPNPGIEPRSPALQAGSLPSEPPVSSIRARICPPNTVPGIRETLKYVCRNKWMSQVGEIRGYDCYGLANQVWSLICQRVEIKVFSKNYLPKSISWQILLLSSCTIIFWMSEICIQHPLRQ